MIRGHSFYAIWDEKNQVWSTDEYDVQRLIDEELRAYKEKGGDFGHPEAKQKVLYLSNYSSKSWVNFENYIRSMPDNAVALDSKLTFSNSEVKKTDYSSKRLPYPLEDGRYDSWDEIVGTLYDPAERAKIEWMIGAIVSGESKYIQKFLVFYGEAGTGKSTILNIIQQLFDGYYTVFEAKALTTNSNSFSTEVFKSNPLVAIQHDGDLSRIEDNSKLNSIVSHEEMVINEKFKPSYASRINAVLLMATNRPVKITDAKSGIIRRLIDVEPSGRHLGRKKYDRLMERVSFELGAIAKHCLDVYLDMGANYYDSYRPLSMMFKTDVFFNFVEEYYDTFKEQDGVTLHQAYSMYKTYCDETLVSFKLPMYKFREELKVYFGKFDDRVRINGTQYRSYYSDFLADKILGGSSPAIVNTEENNFVLTQDWSIFDKVFEDMPAQYASSKGTPTVKWADCNTKLGEINTNRLHFVKPPENHIVIDFDLKDPDGNKSAKLNLEAASKWPLTYAEFSKSGAGVHLHYTYDGDVTKLASLYSAGIEIKTFTGGSSLRRKLTECNNQPIAVISSGLPLKKEKKVINEKVVKSEQGLRKLIERNLEKDIHPATKPSVEFIKKILDDAYSSDLNYDVSDMAQKILIFASKSTHNAQYCIKLVNQMKFKSEEPSKSIDGPYSDDRLVFYDVEVFPNLFLVNWKYADSDQCVRMINPTPQEIEALLRFKLVGFNCRRYDNHILYARLIGYTNEQLYKLSQRIVSGVKENTFFGEAYNISYTDVYDFSNTKQSLKKFEIELGIHHKELGLPWDAPVPEEKWVEVAEYCDNDVIATEAVFNHLKGDWLARNILAELSGLSVNDTTNSHTTRIIFGKERNPQLVYTDLATGEQDPTGYERDDIINSFPGYRYDQGKNMYRGEDLGRGGYVYSKPGMYENVVTFDVASMHPSSIVAMNYFGKYTERFKLLLEARLAIKHKDFDKAGELFNGKLKPFLKDPEVAKSLAYALKIAINSVYGLTSAKFLNPFNDSRNVNNIVALRGALFMATLRDEVVSRGFEVVHIKTDSIKVVNPDKDISKFIMDFGKAYGYDFEIEHIFEKLCLVNKAVYIGKLAQDDPESPGEWEAVGAQFQHPYVFKQLFSKEPIVFQDMCETRAVKTAIYLDMNENMEEGEHKYIFIGKVGRFCPVRPGCGGGALLAKRGDKYSSVTGAKDHRWLEAEFVEEFGLQDSIDESYFTRLADTAIETIRKFGDFELFRD